MVSACPVRAVSHLLSPGPDTIWTALRGDASPRWKLDLYCGHITTLKVCVYLEMNEMDSLHMLKLVDIISDRGLRWDTGYALGLSLYGYSSMNTRGLSI